VSVKFNRKVAAITGNTNGDLTVAMIELQGIQIDIVERCASIVQCRCIHTINTIGRNQEFITRRRRRHIRTCGKRDQEENESNDDRTHYRKIARTKKNTASKPTPIAPNENTPATTNIVALSNREGEAVDVDPGSSSTFSGGVESIDEDARLAMTTGGTLVTEPDVELDAALRDVATLDDVEEVA